VTKSDPVAAGDGVEYLAPLEDRWGEIAQYPNLIKEYADRMIGMVRRARSPNLPARSRNIHLLVVPA